ncbi:hypothetical protein LZ575_09820 [Antarcticibacterium sp. 1MA-6-2]|uniref:hypothetical protein n=1 Tax=Antarcticibacterium sp. 1MA-6-2 TaxID=2908210 RepID=UPI001F15B099|nr:hypothetical protein [Antarcticibacterium sp. 1MA-6-2]UJH92720.1 hypothetical protein LZ575_09820 [Antarcticibacterium sp. 1MA-6-2]
MAEESKFLPFFKYIDQHGLEFTNSIVNGFLYATAGILFSLDKKIFWEKVESQDISLGLLIFGFLINIYFYTNNPRKASQI